jgi:hypothetical protein
MSIAIARIDKPSVRIPAEFEKDLKQRKES